MIHAAITDRDLCSHIDSLEKDGMSVFVMADGAFRGALFHGTRFVNQLRAQHSLGILETMILGQASLCAALLIPTMKGREHVSFRYDTNGPAAGFQVEADSVGYVRGRLLQNPVPVDKPLENWDLAPFFGPGTLSVSRIQENQREPQTGTVEIKFRNIAKDLAWYFDQSEQIATAFNTGIQMDTSGRVVGAGGLFLQAMPSAGGKNTLLPEQYEELADRVTNAFSAAPALGQWFSEKGTRDDIIYGLFREFSPSVAVERSVVFDCPCSYDRFLDGVLRLPESEVQDIIARDPDPVEVVCHNCGSVYHIAKEDLQKGLQKTR